MGKSAQGTVLKKNMVSLAVLQVSKYAFPLVTLPYLTRVLGSDAYAVRAYTVSFMVYVQALIDFGFAQSGTKRVAEVSADSSAIEAVNGNIYAAKALLSLAGLLITVTGILLIPIMRTSAVFVLLSLVSVVAKTMLPDFALQGLQDMGAMTMRYIATQALALLLIVAVVKDPSSLNLIPIIELIGSLVGLVWTQLYLASRHGVGVGLGKVSAKAVFETLRESLPFFVAVAASSFMYGTITLLMGIFPVESIMISCWSIATSALTALQAVYQPVSRALFPYIVKTRDFPTVRRVLFLGEIGVVILVALCMAFAELIMSILGGSEYLVGVDILRYLMLAAVFSYPISVIGYPVLGATGNASRLSFCVAVVGAFQLITLVVIGLAGLFSVWAAVVVRIAAEALLCLLEIGFAKRAIDK